MAVELWIDDGNPWYLSPDIWTVPGDDPNDLPGLPLENIQAYVWTAVHNRGTTAVSNAIVNFYWADPSTSITRVTAHLIGSSSVSLAAGETKPVLCVTPWVPQYVNNGHECLIAEAYSSEDPLPPHTPADPFHVQADRHVAQRNLSVTKVAAAMMLIHPFVIGNFSPRQAERLSLNAKRVPVEILRPLALSMGLKAVPPDAPPMRDFGLAVYRCGQQVDATGKPEVIVPVGPGRQQGMALVARMPEEAPNGSGVLFLVEQVVDGEVTGGVAVLAVIGVDREAQSPATTRVASKKRRS